MPEVNRKRARPDPTPDLEARVRRELETRGVSAAISGPVAVRIAPSLADLSEEARAVFLDGVAAAHGGLAAAPVPEAGAVEIQRLVQDFAIELKKLDEGLRLLSAYLLRIRDRTRREAPRIVH